MPSPAIAAPASSAPPMAAITALSGVAATEALAGLDLGGEGIDFAALLMAQLGAGTEIAADVPLSAEVVPETAEKSEDGSEAAADFSALFAALNMVQQQAQPQTAPTTAPAGDKQRPQATVDGVSLDALGARTPAEEQPSLAVSSQGGGSQAQDDSGNSNGKPANFATFENTLKRVEAQADQSAPVMPDAPAAVHNAHQAHGAPQTANTTAPQAAVQTPVRDPNFGQEFGQKIVWLASQDKQSAQLTLNPPQLGPVEVSLKISGDQATAVFASPHAEVREAIEAALPRLREMMGAAGLELGQANVSSQSFQQQQEQAAQQQQQAASRGNNPGGILGGNGDDAAASNTTVIRRGDGLVDTFA